MKKKYINLIRILALIGLVISIYLVYTELSNPGFCPPFLGIPACNIVLLGFSFVILSTFISHERVDKLLFFVGTIPGLILAIWFSYNQILGLKQCPRLLNIPLCYGSLIVFGIILFLGIKINKEN